MHKIFSFLLSFYSVTAVAVEISRITVAGSSTIQPFMEDLAPILEKDGFKIVVQGGGSGVGIKSTLTGLAQIGMVSRNLTDGEKNELEFIAFAQDAVAIIVNARRPEIEISSQELRSIYTGKTSSWANGKPMIVINKEFGRATLDAFEEALGIKGQSRKDAIIIGPNGQAITAVASNENSIGYVSYADAVEAERKNLGIKILKLDQVGPSEETIKSARYKIVRPLLFAWQSKNRELAKRLLLATRSKEGLELMRKHHFLPTKDVLM